jgi:flagellin
MAQSNLSKVGDSLQTTIQRLSSGLRVNSAADDASGFAIANHMDAQIRGMAVATRNANDAISFSQTATGALSQISNNLQRMRELAVQAANGSNSASDTNLLNQEFSQLQNEVSRIQGSTTFNSVKVFDNNDTIFQIGANTSSNDRVNSQGNALKKTMSLGTQTITDGTTTTASADISTALVSAYNYAATSITSGTAAQLAYVVNAATDAINANQKLSFASKSDALDTVQTLSNLYNASGTTIQAININVAGTTPITTALQAINTFGTGATPITTALNSFTTDLNTAMSVSGDGYASLTGIKLTDIAASGDMIVVTPDAGGLAFLTKSIGTDDQDATTLTFTLGGGSNAAAANAGVLNTTAATSVSSGQKNAQNAISAIDYALTEINTASALQGALQNRFSAVISNLSAFSQSQTAAKSRIVDADFAAETAKLSKNQILQQAGTAMLAQANQIPSTVLSLLK